VKYFFPDSQDLVDPSFDFTTERRSKDRIRQRDDEYAHEVFKTRAFDGLLVSKGIVDGYGGSSSRYTPGQRHRLLRLGAPEFFRVNSRKPPLPIMGDCGAFTYVKEKEPPYTVDELLDFYDNCQFNLGLSLDHVILQYQPEWDETKVRAGGVPAEIHERLALTIKLAREFFKKHKAGRFRFVPIGVAQGWSPKSYTNSVRDLQKIGFKYIALGGMVPLKTPEILECLRAVEDVLKPGTRLHLLGITRPEHVAEFARYGVASFDSTSPLRQAFKDDRDNYYTLSRTYTAIRIPQVEGNPSLQKMVQSGRVAQELARAQERRCLDAMRDFEAGRLSVVSTIEILREYEHLYDPKADHADAYRETLESTPWRNCSCDICTRLGYHVILFRGAERNRRRGFHNVWTFFRRMRQELGIELVEAA